MAGLAVLIMGPWDRGADSTAIRNLPHCRLGLPGPEWGRHRVGAEATAAHGSVMAPTKNLPTNDHSAAWAFQTKVSFVVSLTGLILGIVYLPVEPWVRAYLATASLYAITSAISLSKTLRDEHEAHRVISRVDEVKLERLLAEHDPFKVS